MSKNKAKSKRVTKINILLKHYTFNEICDIIGYADASNKEVATPEMKRLEAENYPEFVAKILNLAVINEHFKKVIAQNLRLPL